MSDPLAPRFDDDPFALDDIVIDGMLDAVDDVPIPLAYRSLTSLLATVRQPGPERELPGEADALAMFRTVRPPTAPRGTSSASRRLLTAKALLAAGALTVASASGAAAATGSLPAPPKTPPRRYWPGSGSACPARMTTAVTIPTAVAARTRPPMTPQRP
jgi:hypothetical protein